LWQLGQNTIASLRASASSLRTWSRLEKLGQPILDMAREWEHLAEQQAHATDLRKKE